MLKICHKIFLFSKNFLKFSLHQFYKKMNLKKKNWGFYKH